MLLGQVVGLGSELVSEHLDLVVRVRVGGSGVSLVRLLWLALLCVMVAVLRRLMVLLVRHCLRSRFRVSDHDPHARVRTRHLSILLQQACILDLWVTIPELMLRLVLIRVITLAILPVVCVLFFLHHRFHLIVFKLTVARIILRIRKRQDVAALV